MTTPVQEITEYWNRRSVDYDDSPGHSLSGDLERDAWQAILRETLPPAPAEVLDVGTGTGFLALLVAGLGHRVTGIDVAEEMLLHARQKATDLSADHTPTFAQGEATATGLPGASMDVIVCRHVLWTLPDPAAAFRRWLDVLRPGGRLIAFDIIRDGTPRVSGSPQYRDELRAGLPFADITTPAPVLEALRDAGFSDPSAAPMTDILAAQRDARPDADHQGIDRVLYLAAKPGAV